MNEMHSPKNGVEDDKLERNVTPFRMSYVRVFKNYVPVFFLLMAALEFLAFYCAMWIAVALSDGVLQPSRGWMFATVLFVAMLAMGLYQRRLREGGSGIVLRIAAAYFLGGVMLASIFYLFGKFSLPGHVVVKAMIFSMCGILLLRMTFLNSLGGAAFKKRVLVLGTGKKAAMLAQLRRWIDHIGFTIIGFVRLDDSENQVDVDRQVNLEGSLLEFVEREHVDELVIAFDDRRRTMPLDDILDCKMAGVQVVDLLTFFERETFKLKLDVVDPSWLIFSDGFQTGVVRDGIKRAFDIFVSASVLLVTSPLMALTSIAVWLENLTGPILYRQVRVGRDGKPFTVYKFRSMIVNAEKSGAQWAQKNDARVTKVGAFIRATRLDELPQLYNVLRGDMSFVGPRPERPEFVQNFAETIPYYDERHRVKPGITGWAQICYPYGASEKDAFEKLQYDLYYAKNYSIFFDLMIILQTIEVVIWRKGSR